jgi:hypothetical protein
LLIASKGCLSPTKGETATDFKESRFSSHSAGPPDELASDELGAAAKSNGILTQLVMTFRSGVSLSLFAAVLFFLGNAFGFGCARKPTMKVILPANFRGTISITCARFGDKDNTVFVDSVGVAREVDCPRTTSRVEIERNGVSIPAEHGIAWMRTGDDIPVGLQFEVK